MFYGITDDLFCVCVWTSAVGLVFVMVLEMAIP